MELSHLAQRGVVDDRELEFLRNCYADGDKKLEMIINAFNTNKDKDDFIDSLSRYCKKNAPQEHQ